MEAARDLTSAIELDPNFAQIYAGRAVVHTALGDEVASAADFDDAVRLGYDPVSLRAEIEAQAEASRAR